jgi:hypothetical protein
MTSVYVPAGIVRLVQVMPSDDVKHELAPTATNRLFAKISLLMVLAVLGKLPLVQVTRSDEYATALVAAPLIATYRPLP